MLGQVVHRFVFRCHAVSQPLKTTSDSGLCCFIALFRIVITLLVYQEGAAFAQQVSGVSPAPLTTSLMGGTNSYFVSQFTNPAVVGALYGTPSFPFTGYYPLYPGTLAVAIPEPGVAAGPLRLHPFMGIAEMYTDNVFRTNTGRRSDFFTTLAPGIQARLPFARRHAFLVDYRTNIQFYSRTPSNDVQDQTATGGFSFNFPWGLRADLQGEHKVGHDPRGSAADLQAVEVNKWTTNGFVSRISYDGGMVGATLFSQIIRWDFLNNNQAVFRNGLTYNTGLTLYGYVSSKLSLAANFRVSNTTYDQNKNGDNTIYTISGGARWDITGKTSGEVLIGIQQFRSNHAPVIQPPPILSQFNREPGPNPDPQLFFAGTLTWNPTSRLKLSVQPYQSIQQTVFVGTFFYQATGVNLSAVQSLSSRIDLKANLGYERDDFSGSASSTSPSSSRTDTLRNVAIGLSYRAVKWVSFGCQYVFEDRDSTEEQFHYQANTVMLSVQALF